MSLTIVKQEPCQGIGTFSNSSPGSNFYTIEGSAGTTTVYKLPGGPRLSGDSSANSYGWSLDMRPEPQGGPGGAGLNGGQVDGVFYLASAINLGCAQAWVYVNGVKNNANTVCDVMECWPPQIFTCLDPISGCFAWTTAWNATRNITAVPYPTQQWFKLRTSWNLTSGTANTTGAVYQWSIDYEMAGSTGAWINIASGSMTLTAAAYEGGGYHFGFNGMQGVYNALTNFSKGRFGMPTVCSMGSWSDRTLEIPGVIDPPAIPKYVWYWDPANASGTASDSNDGTTAATALLSVGAIGTLSQWAGFFTPPTPLQTAVNGAPTGTALDVTQHAAVLDANQKLIGGLGYQYQRGQLAFCGDTLIVNNNNGAEIPIFSGAPLYLQTSGLTFQSSGGTAAPVIFSLFKTIPSSEWSLSSGKTYTYQATDSSTNAVLFQSWAQGNRLAMNHPTGANYAAVAAYIESTPGSFWTDGTTMYVHPFGSTNPANDGNKYERTPGISGANIASGVAVVAPHVLLKGIGVIGTTATDPSVGGSTAAYAFWIGDVSNSFDIYDTCKSDFGSNHDFSQVATTTGFTNCRFALINCSATRGSPYATGGGYWAFVDYCPSGSGNETLYLNCTTGSGAMQAIGSATPSTNGFAWGTHGASSGWQNVFMIGCDFSKSAGISLQTSAQLTIADSKLAGSVGGAASSIFQRVWIYGQTVAPGGTCSNCVFVLNNASPISVSGVTGVLNHCTIDTTKCSATTVFTSAGSNNFTVNETVILGTVPLVGSIQSTDTISMSFNEFQGTTSSTVLNSASLGNLTLAQVQAKGWDGASVMNASPAVDSITYQRTAESAVVHPVGSTTDLTGVDFAIRRTAGAAEYVPSSGVGAILSRDGQLHRARQ